MGLNQILPENEFIAKMLDERSQMLITKPHLIYPWWRRPCKVKVLLLTDSALNFGTGDFGLSTFVATLANDGRTYVDFEITIAHRSAFVGNPGVTVHRSIPEFNFTNASHFTQTMYDQIWFFGYNASGALSDLELVAISTFMNGGGGVFATGDHGEVGKALCGNITRVRKMRKWDNTAGDVGMLDPQRNDTNRPGPDGTSQFEDQSDDIPQDIKLKLYSSHVGGFWSETYPHPIMCSPLGRITVLPDHPHEGQCVEPASLAGNYEKDGTPEFPAGIAPEIIATSSVLAGGESFFGPTGFKQVVQHHTFGAICAYDGHRANIGRVVTDATWHHFVNVNLVGETSNSGIGFLGSASGQAHLAQIKHYYINIAVWISRKSNHSCFNSRFIWQLVFQHRVLEATMNNPDIKFNRISLSLLYSIGTHALDVLGKKAGHCRKLKLVLDSVYPLVPEFSLRIDPWINTKGADPNPPIPWINLNPIIAIAFAGGLLAMRDKFGFQNENADKISDTDIHSVFQSGVKQGIEVASKEFSADLKKYSTIK